MDKIAVLIPCYNESKTIEKVVKDWKKELPEAAVYVYDNNSIDKTAVIAKEAGAIVRHEYMQGKGNVIRRMFREIDAEAYIMVDGDDTYPAEYGREMAELVLTKKVDMVVGDRLSSTYFQSNKRLFHNFGNSLVRLCINLLFHSQIKDIMTGYRAFSYLFVKSFPVLSKGFEIETEMTIHTLDKNMYMENLVIDYRDRPDGSESKLNTYSDGFKVLCTIVKLFRNYRPLMFFGIIAGMLAALSLIFMIPVVNIYLNTGTVPKFPTLIVCGFTMLVALYSLFAGLQLQNTVQKNRQDFEFHLLLIEKMQERCTEREDEDSVERGGVEAMGIKKSKAVSAGMLIAAFYAVFYLLTEFFGVNTAECSFIYILTFIGIGCVLKFGLQFREVFVGNKWLWILAALLSVTTITGVFFNHGLPFENMKIKECLNYLLCVIGFVPLCRVLFAVFFYYMHQWSCSQHSRTYSSCHGTKIFFMSFIAILICWLPVWLAYYPGLWNYDPWQAWEFVNKCYGRHHPLIHTLLLGFCYAIGLEQNNCNAGVILYDFIQMLIMAGTFAYTYTYICRHIYSRIFRVAVLAFYAVFPVNSILAISSTKDVLFSGLVLLCMVFSMQIAEIDSVPKRRLLIIVLLPLCVLMLLFRNNTIYAFYIFIICLCVYVGTKNAEMKMYFRVGLTKILLYCICCLILFKLADIGLTKCLDASEGSVREMFSVTSQQFGRIYNVVNEKGTDLPTLEIINSYYDMSNSRYNPCLADSMKGTLNVENSEDVVKYLKDSIKLFYKYPVVSLDSFLYLTEGSWNINDISHANIYGAGLESRQGYLLTDVKDGFNIIHKSKFPELEEFMERAFSDNEYQKWPILSLLFSPALYFWILIICTLVFFKTNSYGLLLLSSFLWGLYLTILLGPCSLIRYFYPFVVCSPLLVCMANCSISKQLENEKGKERQIYEDTNINHCTLL